jgi:hypothetical protein
MARVLTAGLLCLLVLLIPGGAWADVSLSWTQLESWGIQKPAFRLMIDSGNGKVLFGKEKELDLHLRSTGMGYKLRIFRMEASTAATIQLPLSILDQMAVNDDGTQAIVSGELGTRILEVDVNSGTFRTLMDSKKGQPGFRNDPRIIWFDGQSYYMIGYFYDASGVAGPDVVVRLNLSQSGAAAFEKVADIQPMEKKTSPRYLQRIVITPEQAVFVGGRPLALKVYSAGKVQQLD